MRGIPKNWTTKDISDAAKIHELDDPHIVEDLKDDLLAVEEKGLPPALLEDALPRLSVAQVGEVVPLSASGVDAQWEVDVVKLRVMQSTLKLINTRARAGQAVEIPGPQFLWFPDDNVNNYELLYGNPPTDNRRPHYLRGIDLVLRYDQWPRRLEQKLAERGVVLPSLSQAMVGAIKEVRSGPAIDD